MDWWCLCTPRGLQPVPDEEVIDLYGGTQHIPLYQMSGFYGKVLAPSTTAQGSWLSDQLWVLAPWEAVSTPWWASHDPQPTSVPRLGALGFQSWGWG